ncbi:hypothetical protein RSOL_310570, partial [Rhizoctonia solani AG-3 Rhs1AP]
MHFVSQAPKLSVSSSTKRKQLSDTPTSEATAHQQKARACIEALEAILDAAKSVPPTLKASNTASSAN